MIILIFKNKKHVDQGVIFNILGPVKDNYNFGL